LEFDRSGLRRQAFCVQHGLAGKRLFSRKLKAEVAAQFGRELDESQQAAANGRFLRAASK
jgi:hypothetical protein